MNWPLRWSIQLIITSKPDSAELQRAHTFQTSIRGNNTLYLVFCAIAFWRSYTNLHADTSIWNTFCFPGTAIHISFFMVETIKVRQDAVQRTNASVIVRVILIDSLAYYDYVTQHSLKSCAVLIQHAHSFSFFTGRVEKVLWTIGNLRRATTTKSRRKKGLSYVITRNLRKLIASKLHST